jgi:hypothetical protein
MRAIRGLLVDNDERNIAIIEQTMDLEFERFGWEVKWTIKTSAVEARSAVRAAIDAFDFAIVDLYLGHEQETAIPVVRQLRERDVRTFILVVTSRPERNESFVEEATAEGAMHAVLRGQLSRARDAWCFRNLADTIRAHLVQTGLMAPDSMRYDSTEPGILSVLESLGGPPWKDSVGRGLSIVRGLAIRCLNPRIIDADTFHLSYLVPGRSGAYVCRVDMRQPGEAPESFVLKVGLDRPALELERRLNNLAVRQLGHQVLVAVAGDVQLDQSGYAAIAAKVADGAVTFRQWLPTAETRHAWEAADVLFGEQLRRLHHPDMRDDVPVARWLATRALIRLQTLRAVEHLEEALTHERGGNRSDVGAIRETLTMFMADGSIRDTPTERLGTTVAYVPAFGDLHSSNVLIEAGIHRRPLLIDASRFGQHHWGNDSARMLVDLFLRVRSHGVDSLLWDDFGASVAANQGLCVQCRPMEASAPDDPVTGFIDRVVTKLPEFVQLAALKLPREHWHWQWHVALAKEFIRQSSHPDLPPPRSALALVVAAEQLWSAAAAAPATQP